MYDKLIIGYMGDRVEASSLIPDLLQLSFNVWRDLFHIRGLDTYSALRNLSSNVNFEKK
jgi:hypothetical protein